MPVSDRRASEVPRPFSQRQFANDNYAGWLAAPGASDGHEGLDQS